MKKEDIFPEVNNLCDILGFGFAMEFKGDDQENQAVFYTINNRDFTTLTMALKYLEESGLTQLIENNQREIFVRKIQAIRKIQNS